MEKNQARSRLKPKKPSFLEKYFQHIFCLLIALFAYFLIYLLLNKIYPTQIQNFLFKNSYLPLILLIFIANFFLFTFFSLNKRFGFIVAFLISLLFYFKISNIFFDFSCFLTLLFIGLTLIILAFFEQIKKLNQK